MNATTRRTRWAVPMLAILLAGGAQAVFAPPASAWERAFEQSVSTFVGDAAVLYDHPTAISIPASGTATPYPAETAVPHDAEIVDVNLTLFDLTHVHPNDLDILLEGPHGQRALVMSDVGGGTSVSAVDIRLDDEAASALPVNSALSEGIFQPTDHDDGFADEFPSPAPQGVATSPLSVFDGTTAGGTWRLWINDDAMPDGGSLSGFRLTFQFATTPYPSTITVSGMPSVVDVDVTLRGLTSISPMDNDFLLVAPGGQQSMFMSDAGSDSALVDADVTWDDEGPSELQSFSPIDSGGTYRPANIDDGVDVFPAPAPAPNGAATLSVFDGIDPNGEWSLYVVDDQASPFATSLSGWSLDFTFADTQGPSGTIKVNGGSAATSAKAVTLDLTATDPVPGSGLTEMRLSHDGSTFSPYQPYAATMAWTLSAGDGTKTVYAQFKDADGNESAVVSDTITLDTLAPRAKRVTPARNAKRVVLGTKVKIKASEVLLGATVTKKTVFLKRKGTPGKIRAKVSFNTTTKLIVLAPKQRLAPGSTYSVTVKGVTDLIGHAWDQDSKKAGAQPLKYSFTTA